MAEEQLKERNHARVAGGGRGAGAGVLDLKLNEDEGL